jgi:hypothetical protein
LARRHLLSGAVNFLERLETSPRRGRAGREAIAVAGLAPFTPGGRQLSRGGINPGEAASSSPRRSWSSRDVAALGELPAIAAGGGQMTVCVHDLEDSIDSIISASIVY